MIVEGERAVDSECLDVYESDLLENVQGIPFASIPPYDLQISRLYELVRRRRLRWHLGFGH